MNKIPQTFMDYLYTKTFVIEDIHPRLQAVAGKLNKYSKDGNTTFHQEIKSVQKSGEDTGLDDKTGSGSSRNFYGHREPHKITLDDKEANVNVGTKFAKRFDLDRHTGLKDDDGKPRTLGNLQNENEVDASRHYGLFHKNQDGSYKTNEHGVIAPVLDHHDKFEHTTSIKADKFSTKKFQETTKTKSHPKGLPFKHFQGALMREHDRENGREYSASMYGAKSHIDLDDALEHPITQKFNRARQDLDLHPADIAPRNMGHITHPHTGEVHHVLVDAGATKDAIKLYQKARENKRISSYHNRGY